MTRVVAGYQAAAADLRIEHEASSADLRERLRALTADYNLVIAERDRLIDKNARLATELGRLRSVVEIGGGGLAGELAALRRAVVGGRGTGAQVARPPKSGGRVRVSGVG